MNYVIYLKQLFIFVLFFGMGNALFAFPEFSYSNPDYSSGQVDVIFEASRGVRVSLYSNDNFVDSIDVLGEPFEVILDGSFSNIIMPVNSNLIFRNTDLSRVYELSILGVMSTTLNPGESSSQYFFDTVSNYDITEGITSDTKQVIIEDVTFVNTFSNVASSYLNNGENIIKFTISSPSNNFDTYDKEYNMDYDKFPNVITIDSFHNITNEKRIVVSGVVSDSQYPLFYLLNLDGPIGNTGAFIEVPLDGNRFNFTVTGMYEGLNSIRLISTDSINNNIFTGEEFVKVEVDTEKPVIDITRIFFRSNTDSKKKAFLESDSIDTNSNSIILNITVDGKILNYTFNNKTEIVDIVAGTIELELTLRSGKNDLDLVVFDEAGNIAHDSHQINYDSETPSIVEDSLSPDSVFKEGSVHFFLQNIEGKTNKGNVKMVIFSISEDSTDADGDSVSCNDYNNLFFRQSDDKDEYSYAPIESIPDTQMSLTSLISGEQKLTSDSDGNFDAMIFLQEKNLDIDDLKSNNIEDVSTDNTICMVLVDRYGNEKIEDFRVTFDAGNTVWDDVEITISPQNVYESELLQLEEGERSGSGNVEVGIIATFSYLGGSELKSIESVSIQEDTKTYPDTKYVDVQDSRINHAYDKTSNLLTVYIPLSVRSIDSQEDREERDWFEEISLGFGLKIIYTLEDLEVPIDTKNAVWFESSIVVENTQDWLSPKQIEKWQNFLSKTITSTEKFTNGMKWASVGGVVTCTLAKFKHSYDLVILAGSDSKTKETDKARVDRNLYIICDRIAGLPAPYSCDAGEGDDWMGPDDYSHSVDYTRDGEIVGSFDPKVSGKCDIETIGASGEKIKTKGTWVSGDGKLFKTGSGSGFSRAIESEADFKKQCLPTNPLNGEINFAKLRGQVCYQPGAPNFDDTKCNFFGTDTKGDETTNWEGSGVSGKASSTSIISAIRCGAITDTYSHAKNLLKIQEGIYDCLEQAKVGTIKGSYCQRLFGQAVCDIATNVVLPELQQSFNQRSPIEGGGERSAFDFFGQMKKNEAVFNDRYGGSILGQSGLQSDQILNKACFGAITGDWSALTENILTSIDSNEVEPVFGPPFPESRLQGYDPVTGQLSIRYLYTVGVLSGGQSVTTKVELICDTGASNSDFCPDEGFIVSSEVNAGKFKSKTIITRKGGSKQQSQIITEAPAKVWYNKLRMTHTYELKGSTQTKVVEFPIDHKTETLFSQCTFNAGLLGNGAGYKCDSIFSENGDSTYVSLDKDRTRLIPAASIGNSASRPYFEGNSVFTSVDYKTSYQSDDNEQFGLFYYGVCNEGSEGIGVKLTPSQISGNIGVAKLDSKYTASNGGIQIVKLFNSLRKVGTGSGSVAELKKLDPGRHYIRVFSSDKTIEPNLYISEIKIGNDIVSILKSTYYEDNKYFIYEITIPADKTGIFKVYSTNNLEDNNLIVDVVGSEFGEPEDLSNIPTKERLAFQQSTVSGGICKVYMRTLPLTSSGQVNIENFKTYKPSGDTDSEGNILSNVDLVDGVIERSFVLNQNGNSNDAGKVYFGLVNPIKGQSIDSDGEKLIIPISYILQNSMNKESIKYKLKYTLKSSNYIFDSSKDILSKDILKWGDLSLTSTTNLEFDIPSSLKNKLNENPDQTYIEGSFGTSSVTEVTLNYELVTYNKLLDVVTPISPKILGSVKFNIR